jgi:lysozyme family protein
MKMIMSNYECAFDYILRTEKGLVNNSHDNGGITKYGISLRFLRSISLERLKLYGIFEVPTAQTIIELTLEQAKKIYKGEFWDCAPFDKISNQEHANYIFDMAVSIGIAPAIKCLQRACWSVIKKRDLIDDGILGDKTLATLKVCGFLIMPAMRSERAGYYRLVVQHSTDEKEFIDGWLTRAYCA